MTAKRRSPLADYERAVALYTAAGGQETVQRVVTALSRLSRRLDVFYRDQFVDLGISAGEWTVLQAVALAGPAVGSTPSKLADLAGVSPSTMTHRLDKMAERGLLLRSPDPNNRTRITVTLTDAGWELFRQAVLDAESIESDILAPLGESERDQLATLLEQLIAGLPHH